MRWSLVLLFCACAPSERGGVTLPSFDVDDVVTGADNTALVFEVDAVLGREPRVLEDTAATLNDMVADGYLDKPDGVGFAVDEEIQPLGDPERVWTFAELQALADDRRTLRVDAGTAVIHLLYVDGRYEDDGENSMVLGFAWRGDSIVMLADNIARACESSPAVRLLAPALAETVCLRTEATVLLHEIGHLMGLVNNGTAMVEPHQDEEHGAHDVNEDCLMYWLNERSDVVDVIAEQVGGGDGPPFFDDACLADLRAKAGG